MLRLFNLFDLPLIHRLNEQGIPLHSEATLTRKPQSLWETLFSVVGGKSSVYVWRADERDTAGFVQLHISDGSSYAQMVRLGTTPAGEQFAPNQEVWLPLLDNLIQTVGQQGVHGLIAEVSESGPELPILRRAGFAIYTRQDIWLLEQAPAGPPQSLLIPQQSADEWDISLLYANMVPPLVQLVEPMVPAGGRGWLLREDGDLAAFVHVHSGPAANWLRFFIHPNATTQADEIVEAALRLNHSNQSAPYFCCVRRDQSWLQGALEKAGFQLWASQAVLVKHTVHYIPQKTSEMGRVLAKSVRPRTVAQPYRPPKVNQN